MDMEYWETLHCPLLLALANNSAGCFSLPTYEMRKVSVGWMCAMEAICQKGHRTGHRCLQAVFLPAFMLRHLVNPSLQPLPPLGKPGHDIPPVTLGLESMQITTNS